MALNQETPNAQTGNQQGQRQQRAEQPRQQQQQQQARQGNEGRFTFNSGASDIFGTEAVSRGDGSEYFSKMAEALTDKYKTTNPKYTVDLIRMSNADHQDLRYSAIVVAITNKEFPGLVAYHTLILEATNDPVPSVSENINNMQIEVFRPTAAAYDAKLIQMTFDTVSAKYPGMDILSVDATVIPSRVDPADKAAIDKIATNASSACTTEIRLRATTGADLNMGDLDRTGSVLENRLTFGDNQITNAVGRQARADVTINVVSKRIGQGVNNHNIVNNGAQEATVCTVGAYVDLIKAPQQRQVLTNGWGQHQQMPNQPYLANIIMTSLASNIGRTPGMVWFAIASIFGLTDGATWLHCFKATTRSKTGKDLRDIGYLQIEANLANDPLGWGQRLETKGDDFTPEKFASYLRDLVRPQPVISIDCPDFEPESWYMAPFVAAAAGSQVALNIIYDAADQLTNGHFSKYFPRGEGMFVDTNNRILLGEFTDNAGKVRDLRYIDRIAIANLVGENNPKLIRDYSDTFLRQEFPLNQRLHARSNLQRIFTQDTVVFNGMATRLTFSGAVLEALALAFRDLALPMRTVNPLSGSDLYAGLAEYTAAQTAVFGAQNVFMGYGGNGMGNPSNQYSGFRASPRF